MTDREFLVYGANGAATAPGPAVAALPTLSCFFLQADPAAIDAYCERVLNAMSDGSVTYKAMSSHVMVSFGSMVGGRSLTPPYTNMGLLDEKQFGVWLFVARVKGHGHLQRVERALTFVPYMLVDNPLSLTIGREVNGFAKSWGYFDLQGPTHYSVDAFGGNFGTGETAGRHRLVTMVASGATQEAHQEWDDIVDLVRWVHPKLSLGLPGMAMAKELLHLITDGITWGLFLRQLRSTPNSVNAAYQEVLEAPMRASAVHARMLPHTYDFTLKHLDSSPIDTELGLTSQSVPFGIELSLELELQEGETVWSSTGPQPG